MMNILRLGHEKVRLSSKYEVRSQKSEVMFKILRLSY